MKFCDTHGIRWAPALAHADTGGAHAGSHSRNSVSISPGERTSNAVPGEILIHQYYQKVSYCRFRRRILSSDSMRDVIYLLFHLLSTVAKLLRPSGSKTIIAENLLLKQQLIIHSRARQRAPNLSAKDRALLGFRALFLSPRHIARSAIIIKPTTLLRFHSALKKRKYRQLYSPNGGRKPGPKGPSREVIDAIVEMKQRNPRFGCPRIAQQINLVFDLELDKDTVRRVLATHYKPDPTNRGPSWLTTIGHAKDSLWSVDLFRCESILLKSYWVMVVMDQYTRRIIGFGVHAGNVDGPALCGMFSEATSGQGWPQSISSDNDPLFQYHR